MKKNSCNHFDAGPCLRGYGHAYDESTEAPTKTGQYTRKCVYCGTMVCAPTADQADEAWAQLVAGA